MTNNTEFTWAPLIPLIGGFPISTEIAFNKPPEAIYSFPGLGNDLVYENYQNNIHHKNIGISDFFDKGKLQPTWKKLIRLKLSYEGKEPNNDLIRDIQKNNWGRVNSDNALLDLFPLPSPNNSNWFYNEWSKLSYLGTRKDYYNNVIDKRVEYIQNKIEEYKPEVVVFYSISMLDYWNRIVEYNFNYNSTKVSIDKSYIKIFKKNGTKFVVTPQPAAVYSNAFWDKAGEFIRNY